MDTALAILAGGEGSRMGRAKGELVIAGKPILAHLLDQLAWQGDTVLITAPGRENPTGHELFTRECVDPIAGLGPLRGIITALESGVAQRYLFVPVDMPGVTQVQLAFLLEQHDRMGGLGLMLRRDAIEPMPAILRADLLPVLQERLAIGQRSLYRLAVDGFVQTLDAPRDWPGSVWANLNSPEDLRTFAGQ